MTDDATGDDGCDDELAGLLADVAEECLARLARGESPDPDEYAARHPEAADAVRGVLALLRLAAPPPRAAHADPEASPPPPGLLGDYRIVRELGRGGMGVVYEAEQISLGRRVALKVFPFAAAADPRHLQRFRNEARAAAALDHGHVVKVYGVGSDRGVHYIAMQYVDGRTLADLIQERRDGAGGAFGGRPAPPAAVQGPTAETGRSDQTARSGSRSPADEDFARRAAAWGVQAAEALEHAHGLGVVHRDVKPSNLLVDGHGTLFVTDFGLAKLDSDPGMTGPGDVIGTARYMSPEQAAAEHDLVDHRSDVYSLGATLYELLTLRPAFAGQDRAEVMRRVASDDPVPPRRLDRRVPVSLETVILKAMAKDPARRYRSARELADDLRRFLDDLPVHARPAGVGERVGKWARRHRAVVRAGAAALITAAAALAASTLLIAAAYESEGRHRRVAEDEAARADAARRDAVDREEELRAELYPTDVRRAREAWENGDVDGLRGLLDRHRPRAGEADRRGFEWHYLDASARGTDRVFGGHDFPLLSADASADGRLVATADSGGVVKLWDAAAGRVLRTVRYSDQEVTCVRFAPDGRTLATCGQDKTVRLFDVAEWTEKMCVKGHSKTVTGVSWSPDGARLASGGRDGAVKVWDVATTGEVWSVAAHSDVVRCVAWSPTGRVLATAGKEPEVRLWDPATGRPSGVLTDHDPGAPLCLAFSRSGGLLAVGGYQPQVLVHHVHSRRLAYRVETSGMAWSLAFGWDDRYLLVGRTGRLEAWDVNYPSRVLPVRRLELAGHVRGLACTPDGQSLLAASDEERAARLVGSDRAVGHTRVSLPGVCWAVDPGRGVAVCTGPGGAVALPRFPGGGDPRLPKGQAPDVWSAAASPAANLFFTCDAAGGVFAWDAATGRRTRELGGHPSRLALALSPAGTWLAGGGGAGLVHVWRPQTGDMVAKLPVPEGSVVSAFSPDESLLATASGHEVALWDVPGWSRRGVLRGTQHALALAFSPDATVLAAGGGVNGVTLWEVGTGRRLGVLAEQTGPVRGVAFSPDGRTLATAGADRTVRLWHAQTRRELFTLYRHSAPLMWVRFASPTQLLVGAESSTPGRSEVYVFPPVER